MASEIHCLSLLIRLWQEVEAARPQEAVAWQSEVEHVQTGERWSFATLDELLAFLRRETEHRRLYSRE